MRATPPAPSCLCATSEPCRAGGSSQRPSVPSPCLGADDVFVRLGSFERLAKSLRGFSAALRESGRDVQTMKHAARYYALDQLSIPARHDSAAARLHASWQRRWLEALGGVLDARSLLEPMYLLFRDVSAHRDNVCLLDERSADSADHPKDSLWFLNLQLSGAGVLRIGGKQHPVRPGDAYAFAPGEEHAWTAQGGHWCRAVSYTVPRSALARAVAARAACEAGYTKIQSAAV